MKIILKDIDEGDWILGVRAAKWLMKHEQKDAILSYGEGHPTKNFYAKRNKESITVRPA